MPSTNSAQSSPSLSDLMGQYQDLMGTASGQFEKDMSAAQAITPINTDVLQGLIGSGLSGANNFATSDAWVMSPELFKQTLQSRPDAIKDVGNITSLSDAIFNRSGQRKAAETLATAKLNQAGTALSAAQRAQDSILDRTLRQEESAAQRAQSESQFQRSLGMEKARLAETTRHNKVIESAQMAMRNAEAAGFGDLLSKLPMVDMQAAQSADSMSRGYLDKSGKLKAGHEVPYWNSRMTYFALSNELQQKSTLNIPNYKLSDGTVVDKAIYVRTPTGAAWYGSLGKDPKTGKTLITNNPLVVVPHPQIGKLMGGAYKSSTTMVPRYSAAE